MLKVGHTVKSLIATTTVPKDCPGIIERVFGSNPLYGFAHFAYEVQFQTRTGPLLKLRYGNEIVLSVLTPANSSTYNPPTKPIMQLRFHNPQGKSWVIIESDPCDTSWKVIECSWPTAVGIKYKTMQEFLMANTMYEEDKTWKAPFSVHISSGCAPCKHEWKERTLFTSTEEYCIHCPVFRLKKVS